MEDLLFDLIDLVQSIADGLLFGTTYAMNAVQRLKILGAVIRQVIIDRVRAGTMEGNRFCTR
jgi:hypothetical protein